VERQKRAAVALASDPSWVQAGSLLSQTAFQPSNGTIDPLDASWVLSVSDGRWRQDLGETRFNA
jgi:hypothetical protein